MRIFALILGLVLALPAPASADCGGTDFVAELERTDPTAHADFFERARSLPNGVGKFWKIERPGAKPSYIFGTFHVVEATRVALTREVLGALERSDRLVVEVDADAPPAEAAPTRSIGSSMQALESRLGDELTGKAASILSPRGIDVASLRQATPFEMLVRLEVMPCLFEGGPIMDSLIQEWAHETGMPVVGLEPPGAAYAAFAAISEEDGWELVRETIRQFHQTPPEDSFRSSLRLYLEGDIQAMLDLGRLMSERAGSDPGHARFVSMLLTEHLMTRRNLSWLGRLTEELERGGAFVAVGAGHLPGENGLIALIERKGFTVTRLDPGAPVPGGVQALSDGRASLTE